MVDYPDGTLPIAVNVEVALTTPGSTIPRPKGGKSAKGSATTTATYATIAEITVTDGKIFHLAKIALSCKEDTWVKVRWHGTDASIEYLVMGKIPFTDWFPWDWYTMLGDGAKKIDIQVKYNTAAATAYAELVGEEV